MTSPATWYCIVCGRPTGAGLQCPGCVVGGRVEGRINRSRVTEGKGIVVALDERDVTEATRQEELRQALIAHGWTVYRVGQRDARGTQDSGVADMIVMKPGCGVLFVEAKRPVGGEQSEDQATFQMHVELAGGTYILASRLEHIAGLLQPRGKA